VCLLSLIVQSLSMLVGSKAELGASPLLFPTGPAPPLRPHPADGSCHATVTAGFLSDIRGSGRLRGCGGPRTFSAPPWHGSSGPRTLAAASGLIGREAPPRQIQSQSARNAGDGHH